MKLLSHYFALLKWFVFRFCILNSVACFFAVFEGGGIFVVRANNVREGSFVYMFKFSSSGLLSFGAEQANQEKELAVSFDLVYSIRKLYTLLCLGPAILS